MDKVFFDERAKVGPTPPPTTHLQARSERVQMLRELAHQINGTLTTAADRIYGPAPKDGVGEGPDYADAGGFAQLDLCLDELEGVIRQCVTEAERFSDI